MGMSQIRSRKVKTVRNLFGPHWEIGRYNPIHANTLAHTLAHSYIVYCAQNITPLLPRFDRKWGASKEVFTRKIRVVKNYIIFTNREGGQWPCHETAGCRPHDRPVSDPWANRCASHHLLCTITQYKRTHSILQVINENSVGVALRLDRIQRIYSTCMLTAYKTGRHVRGYFSC